MNILFCIATGNEWMFLLFHTLASIWCSVLNFGHFNRYVVVAHCHVICISQMTYDVEHLFIYLLFTCIPHFIKCQLRSLVHFLIRWFVFLLLHFKSFWYILDNSCLSPVSFVNIFSQSVAHIILFTVSFIEQKFLILMKSCSSIISFLDCTIGVVSKNDYIFKVI